MARRFQIISVQDLDTGEVLSYDEISHDQVAVNLIAGDLILEINGEKLEELLDVEASQAERAAATLGSKMCSFCGTYPAIAKVWGLDDEPAAFACQICLDHKVGNAWNIEALPKETA